MPRRSRRRRMSRRDRKQLAFRTHLIGPAGGKAFTQQTKTYRCSSAARWACSGVTAGDSASLGIGNYNQPLALSNNVTFTLVGTVGTGQHPSGHAQAMQLGFDRALVLSSYYRLAISFVGTSAHAKDFVFCYKFSPSASVIDMTTFTAGGAANPDHWADIRVSKGWVYKEMSGTESGGSVWPSQAVVNIRVPNVPLLTRRLQAFHTTAFDSKDMSSTIGDTTAIPVELSHLIIAVFTKDGTAFTAGDIVIDATCYQRVKLTRQLLAAELVDEVDNA